MGDYQIREFEDGDEESLLATFNHVFKGELEGFRPRTMAEWRWAFRDNPAGRRIWVGVHEGEVVAQFAGVPIRTWLDGGERTFVHCVDSMSHPDHRKGLKRPGLFLTVANAYFDSYGGVDRDWVHFGLPIEEAARIGDKFLKYEVVRNQVFLFREPGLGPVAPPEGVEVIARFDEQVKWLWDRCVDEWGASAIRDADYMNWRFVDHPDHAYVPYGVRDADGVLRGVAVYRKASWVLEDVGFVVDWLVPPDEPEVAELLIEALLARARVDRAIAIALWIPEWSRWFLELQERGFLVHPSEYCMRVRTFHPKFGALVLRDRWWYQMSETDLV